MDRLRIASIYHSLIMEAMESSFERYWSYFGGTDDSMTQGGLYPGVKGLDAVKNMIVDTYTEETDIGDSPAHGDLVVANAIETLNEQQLLRLICVNYEGTPLKDMPSFIQELSTEKEGWFVPPPWRGVDRILRKAIRYFLGETQPEMKMPPWLEKRANALDIRQELVRRSRK